MDISEQQPEEPPETRIGGSHVGGHVKVEDSGTFVGRDQFVGLNVEELVVALRRAFPAGDTRPEQLGQLLDEFRAYHSKLHEWKELHNYLNKIIDAFDQYAAQVDNSYAEKKPRKPSAYQEAWWPVNWKVNEMLAWAQTLQHIGQSYRVLENDQLEGEGWAVDLKAKRDDLLDHFQSGLAFERREGSAVLQRLLQGDPAREWLDRLYNLTREFEGAIKQHMSQADNQLRETATDLYNLSRQALRS